jgi:GNAT superfamily N-acetyltransferase
VADYIPLIMVRDTLDDAPVYPLPAPYTVRWFCPGDEAHWLALQAPFYDPGAITLKLFTDQFGGDAALLAARMFFILDADGQPIGTAAAWLNDNFRTPDYGRIHWVAIAAAHQGQGLAKPLMSVALSRLRELGYTRAYLTTDAARPVAVNLYRRCGFEIVEKAG